MSVVLHNVDYLISYAEIVLAFLCASLRNHYFGFLRVYSEHPRVAIRKKYVRQFCSPSFNRDNIIESGKTQYQSVRVSINRAGSLGVKTFD